MFNYPQFHVLLTADLQFNPIAVVKLGSVCEENTQIIPLPENINRKDHSMVTDYIKANLNTQTQLDNVIFFIYDDPDCIRYTDNKICNRMYEVCPIYMDDCTIDGSLVSDSDTVQYLLYGPNKTDIVSPHHTIDNEEQLCNYLIEYKHVDQTCDIMIYDGTKPYDQLGIYNVEKGQLIIPAQIIPKEEK